MVEYAQRFLRILMIEMDDLEHDIEKLIEQLEKRWRDEEISDYVYKENLKTFQNELLGVKDTQRELEKFNGDNYESLEALSEDLQARVHELFYKHALFEAGYLIIKRRIDKVYRYITEELDT